MSITFFQKMIFCSTLSAIIFSTPLEAQWPTSPDTAINIGWDGGAFKAISDDHGGVYIVRGAANNVYCSRIDSSGNTPWTPQVLDYEGNEIYFSGVATSSDGGLFISYHDYDLTQTAGVAYVDIKIQKLDELGNKMWGSGVTISPPNASGDPIQGELLQSKIIGTTDGGVYVIWGDLRDGGWMTNLFIQRMSSDGNPLWNSEGIRVADSLDGINYLFVHEDNSVTIVYVTADLSWNRTHYVQTYSDSGIEQFEAGGLEMPTRSGTYYCQDNLGNLFYRYGVEHVVRININQLPILDWYDVEVEMVGDTYIRGLCPDDSGGVFFTIHNEGAETNQSYYQWLNLEGSSVFGGEPVPGPISGYRDRVSLVRSGQGFISIHDGNIQIAYKINPMGTFDWASVPIFNGPAEYHPWPTAITDGSDGALYLFENDYYVWTTKVNAEGVLGGTSNIINENLSPNTFTFTPYPNPFNNQIIFDINIEEFGFLKLKLFDIAGRLVSSTDLGFKPAGNYKITWKPDAGVKQNLSSGAYIVRLQINGSSSNKSVTYLK